MYVFEVKMGKPVNTGKDYNFFKVVSTNTSVTSGTWGDGYVAPIGTPYDGYDGYYPLFPSTPQVRTAFRGARKIMLVGVSGTDVIYSFSGYNIHGRISSGQIFTFGSRGENEIYFAGVGTVDVHIWHIGT